MTIQAGVAPSFPTSVSTRWSATAIIASTEVWYWIWTSTLITRTGSPNRDSRYSAFVKNPARSDLGESL